MQLDTAKKAIEARLEDGALEVRDAARKALDQLKKGD